MPFSYLFLLYLAIDFSIRSDLNLILIINTPEPLFFNFKQSLKNQKIQFALFSQKKMETSND